MVRDCWQDKAACKVIHACGTVPTVLVDGSEECGVDPRDFVWRVWEARIRAAARKTNIVEFCDDAAAADMKASHAFVTFVREVWLDVLHRRSADARGRFLYQNCSLSIRRRSTPSKCTPLYGITNAGADQSSAEV